MFFVCLAALLWGVTNPLLKRYTAGFEVADQHQQDKKKGAAAANTGGGGGVLRDVMFLLQRPKYVVTQAVNLSGTVVFFYSLADTEISIAAIVANALTLAITCVVSALIGDSVLSRRGVLGIVLVIVGLGLCTYDYESRRAPAAMSVVASTNASVNRTVAN